MIYARHPHFLSGSIVAKSQEDADGICELRG